MTIYLAASWDGFVSLAACLVLSWTSVYSDINRTFFFCPCPTYAHNVHTKLCPSDELRDEQEICGIPWCAHNKEK